VVNKIEKKENDLLDQVNKLRENNDKLIGITIPLLEYQLATVYNKWSKAGRVKALELDSILKASQIELE